jgi:hypothetical protein
MNTHSTTWSVAAILLFIVVVIITSVHGYNSRIFASTATTNAIDSPEKAYKIWQDKHVKGRILLLFDDYPHAIGFNNYPGTPQLSPSNLVEFSIFGNIVRKLYFIVPETKWMEFRRQLSMYRPLRDVPGIANAQYLFSFSGIPIIAVTPSSIPSLSETVLVYVNTGLFNYADTVALLARKRISSDILIAYQHGGR